MKLFESSKVRYFLVPMALASFYSSQLCACGSSSSQQRSNRDEIVPAETAEISYPHELGMISSQGTTYSRKVIKEKMLPRGSAIMTSSGKLARKGITGIIHAATGAMRGSSPEFEPTVESVANSVRNSMYLASKYQHKVIAIPFIGGSIFLMRIGVTSDVLAETIIRAALEARSDLQIRFITHFDQMNPGADSADTQLFKKTLSKLLAEPHFNGVGNAAQVLQGSITDFSLHGASVIVNAANMEVEFGGGISGAIARATGNSDAIDREARNAVAQFNHRATQKLNEK